jgi:antitoxin component YwqK of YwqJK toxin-antitoxin module
MPTPIVNRKRLHLFAALLSAASVSCFSGFAWSDDLGDWQSSIPDTVQEIVAPEFGDVFDGQSVTFSPPASSSRELLQQRFPNGQIQIERSVAEDAEGNLVNDGTYTEYDAKGTVIRSGSFRMGRKEGKWSQILSASVVKSLVDTLDAGFQAPFMSEATFTDDQLNGDWTITDSKGHAVVFWQFQNGQRQNVSTWFDSRAVAVREINYVFGVPHGPASIAVPGKKELGKFVFDEGRIQKTNTEWHDAAKKIKKVEETVLLPAGHTIVGHDWWNSSVQVTPASKASPIRHGAVVTWHSNGQKSMEGRYQLGEPDGSFSWWYSNGQPQGSGAYHNGAMEGQWVWWHTNGMKSAEGIYVNGSREGTWSSWDESGRIVFRGPANNLPTADGETVAEDGEQESLDNVEQWTQGAQPQKAESLREVPSIPSNRSASRPSKALLAPRNQR